MGTSVVDLIQTAATRRQPTGEEILTLAAGKPASRSTAKRTSSKSGGTSRRVSSKSQASSSSAKSKRPCKYGPRDADGYCPKAPPRAPRTQTSRNRTKVTARTTSSATKQAVDVLTNPRASGDQKAQAVGKVAEVTATEAVRTTVKKAVKSGKLTQYKEPLKRAAKSAIAASLPIAAAVGGGMATSRLQKGRVSKQAEKMLADTIRRTPPGQRNQYTPAVKAELKRQYEAHIRRQNEILFTK